MASPSMFTSVINYMLDILHWLPFRQCILYRISSFVWYCVLDVVPTYLLEPFILTSACSGRQSLCTASRGYFVVPHVCSVHCMTIKHHRAFSTVPGTVTHLNYALYHRICQVPFTNSLRPSFSGLSIKDACR